MFEPCTELRLLLRKLPICPLPIKISVHVPAWWRCSPSASPGKETVQLRLRCLISQLALSTTISLSLYLVAPLNLPHNFWPFAPQRGESTHTKNHFHSYACTFVQCLIGTPAPLLSDGGLKQVALCWALSLGRPHGIFLSLGIRSQSITLLDSMPRTSFA